MADKIYYLQVVDKDGKPIKLNEDIKWYSYDNDINFSTDNNTVTNNSQLITEQKPKETFLSKLLQKAETLLIESKSDNMWSANRLGFLLTVILSNICFWFPYLYLSLLAGFMIDVPINVVTLYVTINGVAGAYKYFQKTKEND